MIKHVMLALAQRRRLYGPLTHRPHAAPLIRAQNRGCHTEIIRSSVCSLWTRGEGSSNGGREQAGGHEEAREVSPGGNWGTVGQRRAENGASVSRGGLRRRGRLKGGKWDKEVSGVSAQGDSGKNGTMLVGGWRSAGLR